ncbi:hypothetical protein B5M09_012055 [Aphanomyces astaci]|uniref:FZ domain-containing protein n=1 Tax=Aphanomyces astaci TaxID=112090 RepID=A0A425DHE9_APHAT|nr:hypothetical protein B5M09_012055 [Aphanomyces astaci]
MRCARLVAVATTLVQSIIHAVPCSSSVDLANVTSFLEACEASVPGGNAPQYSRLNTTQYCSVPACRSYEDAVFALPCDATNRTSQLTKSLCAFIDSTASTKPPSPTTNIAPSSPCSSDIVQVRTPLKLKCRQVFGSRNPTTQEDLRAYCAIDTCVANVKQYANLSCTVGEVAAATYATICDDVTSTPYVPPATTCSADVVEVRGALKLRCEQVSGFPSLMNASTVADLEAYCAYPECKANVQQYANLTCGLNGYPSSLYASICDDVSKPPPLALPQCSAEVVDARAALKLKCQQDTGLSPLNLTTSAARTAFCVNIACSGHLKQYANVNCSIYGAPAAVWSTLCEPVVKSPYFTTPAPTPPLTKSTECAATAYPFGFDVAKTRCTTAAGITSLMTSSGSVATLAALCQFPECATTFLLFKGLACTFQGVPASTVAAICTPVAAPRGPVTTSVPSVATTTTLHSNAILFLGLLVVMSFICAPY